MAGTNPLDNPTPPPGHDPNLARVSLLDDQQFWLAVLVLVFGLAVLLMEYRLLSRHNSHASEVLRVFTVTLIIVISFALIAAAYGPSQIAPALGLFGTIVGYLLGNGTRRANEQGSPPREKE